MSSKESGLSVETVLVEATPAVCHQIRIKLINDFEDLWLYVYTNVKKKEKATLTVANAFGGKLGDEVLEKVKVAATEAHRAILS